MKILRTEALTHRDVMLGLLAASMALCLVVIRPPAYVPLSPEEASVLYGTDGKTANAGTAIPCSDCTVSLTGDEEPQPIGCKTEDPCNGDNADKNCQYCQDETLDEQCMPDTSWWEKHFGFDCQPKAAYGCATTQTFTGACKIVDAQWKCKSGITGYPPMKGVGCGGRTVSQCDPGT